MSTVSEVMAQRSQFSQAYYTGKITQQQYDTAMSFTSNQLQQLQPKTNTTPTQTQQTSTPSIPNPNPPGPASENPVIQDNTGTWISTEATVQPIVTHNPEQPLTPTITGYEVTPPAPQEQQISYPEPTSPTPQSFVTDLLSGKGLVGALMPGELEQESRQAATAAGTATIELYGTLY